jgi:hypothetical protein
MTRRSRRSFANPTVETVVPRHRDDALWSGRLVGTGRSQPQHAVVRVAVGGYQTVVA